MKLSVCRSLPWPLVAVLLLAACGGRASHPVEAATPLDDRLSCDHLSAERRVNDARIADLKGEKNNAGVNNAGFLVFQPLFLDVSNSENKEIAAFQERNKVLDRLISERCAKASATS
jgi:hypothetical protein